MPVAIIQARLGSSRLPGKTLADVGGKPMLERVLERLRACAGVEEVILATTTEKRDEPLAEFARARGLKLFRGSESDVLDRITQAARQFGARDILRVTPDCPLVDPGVIGEVLDLYRTGRYDYVSNTLGRRYPDGLDAEVFSFAALEASWKEARLSSEREHVTAYLLKHPERFRIGQVEAPADYAEMKWSVDTEEDLKFVREVYEQLGGKGLFSMKDVLGLARRGGSRMVNEGYYRSLGEDPAPEVPSRGLERSRVLAEKAAALIPGGSQTLSKGPTQFVQGIAPSFLVKGEGCRVWDVDGNEYMDCAMALGPVILGYRDPDVDAAVRRQLEDGASFSLPHPLEVEVAERLSALIPCAERVRFGKNGSDVTSGAVRLARAVTGRDLIACCGYHGWQDWFIGTTPRNLGVPHSVRSLTLPFEYNNLESLRKIFRENPGRVAGVILEPVGVVEPHPGFLEGVRELARREGALLVFDEILTGFRLSMGGAQSYFGVEPDLACFGKAIANGLPLSALVGKAKFMSKLEEVFFSFTFGGETLSLAAAAAALRKLEEKKVPDHLWQQGRRLQDGFRVLARQSGLEGKVECLGLPPRTVVNFNGRDAAESLSMKSVFQQECIKRGVLFTGSHMLSFRHGQAEVDFILRVYAAAMRVVAGGLKKRNWPDLLEAEPVQPVFRQA